MGKSSISEQAVYGLEILKRIPTHRYKSIAELHDELKDAGFDRCSRSTARALDGLEKKFPIKRLVGNGTQPHAFRLDSNAKGFCSSRLTNQESLMIGVLDKNLSSFLPSQIKNSLKCFFEHSKSRLLSQDPSDLKLEKQWLKKVIMVSESQELMQVGIDDAILNTLTDALYNNKQLELVYQNQAGKQSDKVVLPLGLVKRGTKFYMAVKSVRSGHTYTIAIHRIKKAKKTTLSFTYPKDFDLIEYAKQGRFDYGEGKEITVEFVIKKEAIKQLEETPLAQDQFIEKVWVGEEESHVKVTAVVIDSFLIDKFVYGYGPNLISYKKIKSDGSYEHNEVNIVTKSNVGR